MRRVSLIAALTLVVAFAATATAIGGAFAATATAIGGAFLPVKGNPADKLIALPIDDYRYDNAKDCRKQPTPGAEAFAAWLEHNAGGQFWGIMRCERWGKGRASLHAEGRAVDWHLDVHNAADKREATRLIGLLLAPDQAGNLHALARRMGIQEIIWNCQSWYSGSDSLRPYSPCFDESGKRKKIDDTTAHKNHIHFGLNWPGAKMRTTFWSQGK